MRRVVWSERAYADYLEAVGYIALDGTEVADRVSARILSAADALGRIPTGRPGRVAGAYEKSLTDVKYIVAYSLDEPIGTLNVLRVIHTSRDWKPGTWPD